MIPHKKKKLEYRFGVHVGTAVYPAVAVDSRSEAAARETICERSTFRSKGGFHRTDGP
jgi:hypothetical protein